MNDYLHLRPNSSPPDISDKKPFRAVLIADSSVADEWQESISDWLVRSGCLYMMAWGEDCGSWDNSVDLSNLKAWNHLEIPEESFVMTTWHEDESIEEVFWFSKNLAHHSSIEIANSILIHISDSSNESELLEMYSRA